MIRSGGGFCDCDSAEFSKQATVNEKFSSISAILFLFKEVVSVAVNCTILGTI